MIFKNWSFGLTWRCETIGEKMNYPRSTVICQVTMFKMPNSPRKNCENKFMKFSDLKSLQKAYLKCVRTLLGII